LTLGFITVLQDVSGWIGGYLLTNGWGRPLEFRLTSAVQPNRVQRALYGPTLHEFVFVDLIGKTLVEKSTVAASLLITDIPLLLALRTRVQRPVVAVRNPEASPPPGAIERDHPRCRCGLWFASSQAPETETIVHILDQIDPSMELSEPFSRIREAIAEARKLGTGHRAA
jgi:hypothetical protein